MYDTRAAAQGLVDVSISPGSFIALYRPGSAFPNHFDLSSADSNDRINLPPDVILESEFAALLLALPVGNAETSTLNVTMPAASSTSQVSYKALFRLLKFGVREEGAARGRGKWEVPDEVVEHLLKARAQCGGWRGGGQAVLIASR